MNTNSATRTTFIATFAAKCLAAILLAAGTAAAQEIIVSPNRGLRDDLFVNPDSDTVATFFQEGRSYSCVLIVREFDSAVPKKFPVFEADVTAPDSSTVTGSLLGSMKPGIAVPSTLMNQQNGLRISLIAEQMGRYIFSLNDAQGTGTAIPGTNVRCNDTTLYGGFNRFFADIAIVELSNDTASDITAQISIIDFSGTVLVDNQELLVPAGRRADAIFADLPEERFGQIIVTYVGSLGALSGYVSEYDLANFPNSLKRERPMTQTEALP